MRRTNKYVLIVIYEIIVINCVVVHCIVTLRTDKNAVLIAGDVFSKIVLLMPSPGIGVPLLRIALPLQSTDIPAKAYPVIIFR